MGSPAQYGYQVYGTPTPFVGREAELSQIYDSMREVTTDHALRCMIIEGQRGIGKSRLVEEFLQRTEAERRGVPVYRTRFQEGGLGTSFAPLTQIVRQRFAIDPEDGPTVARTKLLKGLADLVDGKRLNDAVHLLGALLQLPFTLDQSDQERGNPALFMTRAYQTCFNLVRLDATTQPVIIVFDSGSQITSETTRWIHDLLNALSESPVLVLILTEEDTTPTDLPTKVAPPARIALTPLNDESVHELLNQFLMIDEGTPPDLLKACTAYAKGLPRSVEDILRLLVQRSVIRPISGGWGIDIERLRARPIPKTTSAIALERLANLEFRETRLLEAAAILGPHFWMGGILSILHSFPVPGDDTPLWENTQDEAIRESLGLLINMEIIRPIQGTTLKGEEEFVFVNETERQELLRGIDPAHVARLHRLAAQWMKTALPTEPSSWHVYISECLERGDNPVAAARHLVAAGDISQRALDHVYASDLYRRALALIDVDNAALCAQAIRELAWLSLMAGQYTEAEAFYKKHHAMNKVLRNPQQMAFSLAHVGKIHRAQGLYESARSHFNQALSIYEENDDLAGVAAVKEDIGKLLWHVGAANAYDEAASQFLESLRLWQELGDLKNIARCLSDVANVEILRGNIAAAKEHHLEALSIRRKIGDRRGVAMTLNGLAALYHEKQEGEKALHHWSEALQISLEIGDRTLYAVVLANLGECHLLLDDVENAVLASEEAVAIAHELNNVRIQGHALRNLAQISLHTGANLKGIEQCDTALEVAEEAGNRYIVALCLRTRAELFIQLQRADEDAESLDGETDIDRSIVILEEIGNKIDLQRSLEIKAQFLDLGAQPDVAQEYRDRAHNIRTELNFADASAS